MSFAVVDLPVRHLHDAAILHRRTGQIFDHFVAYLNLQESWPAVTLAAKDSALAVSRGGEILDAARLLGRVRLRAVITDPDAAPIRQLLASPSVRLLDWAAIDAAERGARWHDDWHVLFFAEPLSELVAATLEREVRAFFPEVRDLAFTDGDRSLRYRVRMPAHDESWYPGFLALLRRFSSEHVRILSFQGSAF
ncbi:hypothetical protein ACTI_45500 [Actinoplanes sp. OR16]|uniref:hypothetical protein n=1 Tax=Actinoplanes sp. OR16 TaxID=946334 RepID=UPI000F6C0578|nr:hypothetical protein [Actinoplanes sp. OR16]BBH67865.1 hypothetical protein ACTI_45500 [Actinoplanes sp. OR16]